MAFPEKLKALRLENGLTQDELGEKLYLSKSSISSYEIGKKRAYYRNHNSCVRFIQCHSRRIVEMRKE